MSRYRAFVWMTLLGFVAVGASSTTDLYGQGDRSNPLPPSDRIKLDERGMVAAVGAEPVRAYKVDGGYGLHFHTLDLPAFVIEYRVDRTKVAWMRFEDELGQHGPSNALNQRWAQQVLSYSLGTQAARQMMDAVDRGEEISYVVRGHRVDLTAGGHLILVTIHHTIQPG